MVRPRPVSIRWVLECAFMISTAAAALICVLQLDSLKKDLMPVRLTLERDCTTLPTTTINSTNNSNIKSSSGSGDDAASAAGDGCSLQADSSMNSDSGDVTRSPSPSLTRNVKRRSTVPKGFVTLVSFFLFVSLSLCLFMCVCHSVLVIRPLACFFLMIIGWAWCSSKYPRKMFWGGWSGIVHRLQTASSGSSSSSCRLVAVLVSCLWSTSLSLIVHDTWLSVVGFRLLLHVPRTICLSTSLLCSFYVFRAQLKICIFSLFFPWLWSAREVTLVILNTLIDRSLNHRIVL